MAEIMINGKTENEARMLWCPMIRFITYLDPNGSKSALVTNRRSIDGDVTCIASSCALWKWYDTVQNGERIGYCGIRN